MAEKPPEEGYISVVDEEPEFFELLKWDSAQTQKEDTTRSLEKAKSPEKRLPKPKEDLDPFDLTDSMFMQTYRLSKDLARNLVEELTPVMPDSTKLIDGTIESKVMAALSFYATGKYLKPLGKKADPSITQYFVSTSVAKVTEALNDVSIVKKYIHFPHLKNERDIIKTRFYMKYGVPNVVGCIDCMHVPIAKPDQDQKNHFNKSYHSKKVQIICDSDSNIISVNANPGGSHSHDAILNTHAVKIDLESLNNARDLCWLIGGPHYSQKPYIMTPVPKITKKSPMSPEKYYTTMVSQAHDVVLNTIKQLKSRWKCLQATCNKQFDPSTVAQMSVACCILHNICNKNGIPEVPMTPTEERLEAMKQKVANAPISKKQVEDPSGVRSRAQLIDRLWNERRVAPENTQKKRARKDKVVEPTPVVNHQHMHQMQPQHLHEDPKRPRILMNTPYTLGMSMPGWGHYPQH
ncbi:putative nuclease HARBI1 [Aricia agestis]|uniref:putative nuclease HARBI1 n=1 Tax=Aricia agestis TaxID=91739 RepID=UPI001C209E5C|nr:putative nuclease HARBI1 [Aricia agestis]